MKKILIFSIIGGIMLLADSNDTNHSQEKSKINSEIEKQMEKEKKYAKEKTFYQGKEYDLKSYEIDPDSLSKIPSLEPDDDFDMSEGVYSD
jgi:hypothetical protein